MLHHEARGAGSSVASAPATETNEVGITVEHDFDPRAKPPAVNVLVGPRQHLVNIGVSHVPLLARPCGQAGRRIAAKVDPVHGLIDLPSGSSENGGLPPGTSHLVLNKSQVDGNTATAPVPQPGSGGGPPIAAGGIANGSEAVLNNSEVDNNTASHTSGAGIVNHGSMTLNKSDVNGNKAAGSGVFASGGGSINAQGPPGAVTVPSSR